VGFCFRALEQNYYSPPLTWPSRAQTHSAEGARAQMRPPACVANKTAGAKVLFAASLVPNGTGVTWTKQNKRQIGNPKHNVRLPSYFQLGGPPLCLPSNKFGPIERQTGAHNKSAKFEGRNQGRSIKLAPFSAPFATPVPVCKL